jgi:hypothetical protein
MKTCVLLSGKSGDIYNKFKKKNIDFTYYYSNVYNTIIKPFNADVFISTWNFSGIENIIRIYNPMLIRIEDYEDFYMRQNIYKNNIIYNKDNDVIFNSIYPMFYKIYDCGLLKKEYESLNNFKYDLVIRSRFDLIFGNIHTSCSKEPYIDEMSLEEIDDSIKNDVIYLRKDPFVGNKIINDWIWDQFAFSNSKTMDIYNSTYLNLTNILNSGEENCDVHEKILYYNLRNNNVETKHTHVVYGLKW